MASEKFRRRCVSQIPVRCLGCNGGIPVRIASKLQPTAYLCQVSPIRIGSLQYGETKGNTEDMLPVGITIGVSMEPGGSID